MTPDQEYFLDTSGYALKTAEVLVSIKLSVVCGGSGTGVA